MSNKNKKKNVKASEVKKNPKAGKTESATVEVIPEIPVETKAKEEAPIKEAKEKKEPKLSAVDLQTKLLNHAYHGSRETERKANAVTGKQFSPAIVASILKQQKIAFTTAEARDGTILRAYNHTGDEQCRFFFSIKSQYAGMFGVSGKVRTLMEVSCRDAEFNWKQQGTKNYYFSGNTEALLKFLGA